MTAILARMAVHLANLALRLDEDADVAALLRDLAKLRKALA